MPTILVIDDDRDSRDVLCELLRREGYETIDAANGREALAVLEQTAQLGLILLDLMMPVMNGWEFRQRQAIHTRHGRVPVVVLTADACVDERTHELEVERLFAKPVHLPDLLAAVRELCQEGASARRDR